MRQTKRDAKDGWQVDAACKQGWDPEMWFPEAYELTSPRTRMAKSICSRCPVMSECYEFGKDQFTGIWGGVYFALRSRERERLVV